MSINRPVGSFSGGQQQSVAIARALTFDPKLVIMDEPTAALAVREVQGVLDLIRQLKSEGIGVILISHRLNDVLSVTDGDGIWFDVTEITSILDRKLQRPSE